MYKVLKGSQYFVDGNVEFPYDCRSNKFDGSYRTRFGPCVEHNGVILSASDHNMKYAVRRMIGKRFPGIPGKDEMMIENQRVFIQDHLQPLYEFFSENSPSREDYNGTLYEARLHHMDPHAKRELRIAAYKDSFESGLLTEEVWMRGSADAKVVLYKAKKNEYAKPNKYLRAIGDLGVSASLEGAWLTKQMKNYTDGVPLNYKGGTLTFIQKPDGDKLTELFKDVISPKGRFAFYLHSDDSVLGIRVGNKVYWFNIDISGCDASHSKYIFALLEKLSLANEKDMKRLVDQCRLPFVVRSHCSKAKIIFKTRDNRPRLYSGSTITTLINNLANYLIGLAIADTIIPDDATAAEVALLLQKAIEKTGYIVTMDICEYEEDISFLKNGPIRNSKQEFESMLHLGVPLRASGTCKGDLPGKGALAPRARAFQASLLQGCYPRAKSTVIDLMKEAAGPVNGNHHEDYLQHKAISDNAVTYDDQSIYRRYRLTPREQQLLHGFAASGFGEFSANTALDKILNKDYGLRCVNEYAEDLTCDPRHY